MQKKEDLNLADLLRDRTFVDFFNVFLSLPIFSQRVLFKFDQREFEFDPPVKKSKYRLDRKKLIKWLTSKRLPLFVTTDLYHEYELSQQLQYTRLYFSQSSHDLDYVEHKRNEDDDFTQHCIGNVIGMRKFRHYLRGTVGERLLNFWMDAEKFKKLPDDDIGRKWRMYRDMQTMYFKGKNVGSTDVLKDDGDVLLNANWSKKTKNYKCGMDICYIDTPNEEIIRIMQSTDYREIQDIILAVIKGYWFQRYALHCKLLHEKVVSKSKTGDTVYRILNKSDIAILKDIKEIDKALRLLQGNLVPDEVVRKRQAVTNWRAMFPENEVDESYLGEEGEVVTLHQNGSISVNPIDSTLDDILSQFIHGESSSSNDEDYHYVVSKPKTDTVVTGETIRAATEMKQVQFSRMNGKKETNRSKEEVKFPTLTKGVFANQQISEGSDSAENMDLLSESKSSESSLTDIQDSRSFDLMKKIVSSEGNQKNLTLSHANLHLFDQLLQLAFSTCEDDRHSSKDSLKRSKSTPLKPVQLDRKFKLPNIKNSKHLVHIGDQSNERNRSLDVLSKTGGHVNSDVQITSSINSCKSNISSKLSLPRLDESQFFITITPELGYSQNKSRFKIETPTFEFKNRCEGYFRYDNRVFTLCIATDSVAGRPFQTFLEQNRSSKALVSLNFWNDAQQYLTTNAKDLALKTRRAQMLVVRYLLNRKLKLLPKKINKSLQNLLPHGKADEFLRQAQDILCEGLYGIWFSFSKRGKKIFNDMCILKITKLKKMKTVTEDQLMAADDKEITVGRDISFESMNTLTSEGTSIYEEEEYHLMTPEKERMLERATQFALDAALKLDEGLLIEPLFVDELVWNPKNEHGSLFIDKIVLIQRRDLLEYKDRLKWIAKQKKARLEMEKLRLKKKTQEKIRQDDTPFFMKPFKKGGEWYHRPNRPRSFQDILKDFGQKEFFRRFLIYSNAEAPMNFFNAVEELKLCSDHRSKQSRISQITRKYFSSVSTAIDLLGTNADIVQAIPAQEKVTVAMLISAQSWVARALNDKWFEKYQNTFPEEESDNLLDGIVNMLTDGGQRRWGKERTKRLWKSFLSSVIRFRRDILDPQRTKHFEAYLKGETRKEVDKQKLTHGYAHGMPIRKVIRNKLIDVTKLVNDMHFVAETDRYRTLCDDARYSASTGAYCYENEKMIENKAKMIIDCFIDSDIPPKTQINLSMEQTDTILSAFKGGLVDRSLFHQATVNILPVVLYLWKKFHKYQFQQLYEKWEAKRKLIIESQHPDTKLDQKIPDYINTTYNNIVIKRIIATKAEEDICRLQFSMSNGMKMIIPMYTPATYSIGYNASEANNKGETGTSMSSMNRGPSFLKNRRYAVVTSKMNLNAGSQSGTSHLTIKRGSHFSSRHIHSPSRHLQSPSIGPTPEILPNDSSNFNNKLQNMLNDTTEYLEQ